MDLPDLGQLARQAAREELPSLLGRIAEAEAVVRLRLAEPVASAPAGSETRLIDVAEASAIAGTSARWLLTKTRGMSFRRDFSRKRPRFIESALRAWLATRGRR